MIKNYLVAGVNWVAEIPLEIEKEDSIDAIKLEACTRAIEARVGKRNDIVIKEMEPMVLSDGEKSENPIRAALIQLFTTELVIGCGIGAFLCVMEDKINGEDIEGNREWYVSSKTIFENAGIPKMVESFNKQYPQIK